MRWRLGLAALALCAAVVMIALSRVADGDPPAVEVVGVRDDGAAHAVVVIHAAASLTEWRVTDDGHLADEPEPRGVTATSAGLCRPPTCAPVVPDGPAADAPRCAGSDCYRVVPGRLAVEHSGGGGWVVAWSVGGAAYRALAREYADLGDPAVHLAALSLVVRPVTGGHVVFVAAGRDGVVYRDARGRWERLGIPAGGEGYYWAQPPRLITDPPPTDPRPYVAAVVFGLVWAFAGLRRARRVRPRPHFGWKVLVIATAAAGLAGAAAGMPPVGTLPGAFYAALAIFAVLTVAAALIWRE
ncbi:hypothetical protein Val02_18680 [Virgisporangium aliadipatigenens]|uniref:Uncharacterized protein n=1 Tax=Virgisporangium aliadipatigenens TaxID=741659 RepID=A0A8J4DQ21_9ACTN|nr:hypothetical protein [Virgisporangium aliadipatigenens]GIJ44982.1 hypothetical protein Val02_18680 [Virgisporangium aliadipatigenens]